jgi:hypothetical protein
VTPPKHNQKPEQQALAAVFLLAHDSVDGLVQSALYLRSLGAPARRILAESVEHTGVTRKSISVAARHLEDAGFMFIRDHSSLWDPSYELVPSLLGEEALEALELLQAL